MCQDYVVMMYKIWKFLILHVSLLCTYPHFVMCKIPWRSTLVYFSKHYNVEWISPAVGCYDICKIENAVFFRLKCFWMPFALARLNHPLSAVYMRQWTGSVFLQVMVCHFFDEKPLPEPIMDFCQLDPKEQTGGIGIKIQNFSFMKI